MTTVMHQLRGLPQLFRFKPVMSWGISAFLLGVAAAVATVGGDLNYLDGGLALLLVLLVQGVVSHGFNDAYDWLTGTDKESIGKGTGGSRVIPEGKMTVAGTAIAATIALALSLIIGAYFVQEYGEVMIALITIAVWASVGYSLPPFKLGYRPFSELTVVLPAITGVVVGTNLVLAGGFSWLSVGVGVLHATFCISWFLVSRMPDYDPDRKAGKRTTVVRFGRHTSRDIAIAYVGLGLVIALFLSAFYTPIFYAAFLWGAVMIHNLHVLRPQSPEMASKIRLANMRQTAYNAFALAVLLSWVGV